MTADPMTIPATRPEHADRDRSYTWADPAISAVAARGPAGLTFLQMMLDGELPPPPVMVTLGFTLASVEAGRAVFEMVPAEFHYNPIGSVHGGVIATLLDSAAGCAVQTSLPAGTYYTSLDLSVKFLRALTIGTGPVRCEGIVVHLGGRTALAEARLVDGQGRLCAQASSSCLVFRP